MRGPKKHLKRLVSFIFCFKLSFRLVFFLNFSRLIYMNSFLLFLNLNQLELTHQDHGC